MADQETDNAVVGQCSRCGLYLNRSMAKFDGDEFDGECSDAFARERECRPVKSSKAKASE